MTVVPLLVSVVLLVALISCRLAARARAARGLHPQLRLPARTDRRARQGPPAARAQGPAARRARAAAVLPRLLEGRTQAGVDALAGRRRPVARVHPLHAALRGVLPARVRRVPAPHAGGRARIRQGVERGPAPRVLARLPRGEHQPAQADAPAAPVRARPQARDRRRLRVPARLPAGARGGRRGRRRRRRPLRDRHRRRQRGRHDRRLRRFGRRRRPAAAAPRATAAATAGAAAAAANSRRAFDRLRCRRAAV